MARPKEYLSASEWEIMNVVWNLGGKPTVKNVHEILCPNGEKAYTTVHTIMDVLVEKGFLQKEKFGPVNLYIPLRNREEAISKETNNFMNKVFDGSFERMASFMVKNKDVSDAEIDYLKDLIRQVENKQGKIK